MMGGMYPTCKFSSSQQGALQAPSGLRFSGLTTLEGFSLLSVFRQSSAVLPAKLLTSVLGLPVTTTYHAVRKVSQHKRAFQPQIWRNHRL